MLSATCNFTHKLTNWTRFAYKNAWTSYAGGVLRLCFKFQNFQFFNYFCNTTTEIRTDSIAAWVNEWVIHEPTAKTQIGCDRSEWADKDYNPLISTLFGSYSHYCRVSGLQAKGKNNFSSDLIELCQQTLGWGDVNYNRDNQGRRLIFSLRLRTDSDTTLTLDDVLDSDNLSDNCSDNPSDNLKPFQVKESDNRDNLLTSKFIEIENQISSQELRS